MDQALWITWYDLPDSRRDAYLDWLHSTHMPALVERPGVLWAAHFASVAQPVLTTKARQRRPPPEGSAPTGHQPELITPVLRIVHRAINTHLIQQAGIERQEAATGAITLIQRFGSAANLNIHLSWAGSRRRVPNGLPDSRLSCTPATGREHSFVVSDSRHST